MSRFLTLHDPSESQAFYDEGLWTKDTFYGLLQKCAESTPNAAAIRDAHEWLDWRALKTRVDALADDFLEHEIGCGARVSIWLPNRIDAVVTFLACSREGIACNPSLHRSYTSVEVTGLLTELQSSALVTEPGWGANAASEEAETDFSQLPFIKKVYRPANMPRRITQPSRTAWDNPDTIAYLAFTSGTTGRPKCVMHSSNTLLSNARDLVRDWSIGSEDVILSLSPLSHHIAWVAVGQWLICGCELVTADPPQGITQLDWIVETRATYVMGVPTHAMDILSEQKKCGIAQLGSVRIFYMAGAPIPEVVANAFVQQGITPQNIYGMTECSSHQYTHPDDTQEIWISTCGRGGPAYEVKIWDPENRDREMPAGSMGEIGGRGAALMLGYYSNQPATAAAFNCHGYLMSGDLGSIDSQGNLRVEGRLKDLIIRGGHNIYPTRIESLALTHAAIEKAAAFPVPDERLGERVCLAIIGNVGAEDVLEHLAASGLSKHDMPEWFIATSVLPLTASGKILKRALTEMVRSGEIKPQAVRYSARK